MRAHYLPTINEFLPIGQEIDLDDLEVYHLITVVRIQKGESLLLLNGKGLQTKTDVLEVTKKKIKVKVLSHTISQPYVTCDVAVGITKREAQEDVIRFCVELGIPRIFPFYSDYSSEKLIAEERLFKIAVSALKQSNNTFLPEIQKPCQLRDLPLDSYVQIIHFNEENKSSKNENIVKKSLVLIGAEGGFSSAEVNWLENKKNVLQIHLPTPILRTPTALCVALGYYLKAVS